MTTTSAPIPACRCFESFTMPNESPTISRISVTSRATATTLIKERIGRYSRLPTIILFIMKWPLVVSRWQKRGCVQCSKGAAGVAVRGRWRHSLFGDDTTGMGFADRLDRWLTAQTHHLGSRRLLQCELFVGQGLVDIHFHDIEGYVVLLLGP